MQILDPLEVNVNLEGDFNLVDMESNATMQTFISPYLKEKYGEGMRAHKAQIQEICDEIGAEFYSINSDKQVFDSLFEIIMQPTSRYKKAVHSKR